MDEEQGLPILHGLDQFQSVFDTPESREWAQDQTTRLNDYVVRRELADSNSKAGDNFVANLQAFGNSLAGAVHRDPHFLPTALEMAKDHIASTIATNPAHPDESREDTHAELTGQLQKLLATTAVRSLGDSNDGAARSLMDADHVAPLLDDNDRSSLNSYIDLQKLGRGIDTGGNRQMQAAFQAANETASVLAHARDLHNKELDDTQFPPGWAQRMLRDPNLSATARADLIALNARMQVQGDSKVSDPFMVAQAVKGISEGNPISPQMILQNAGGSLRLPDALMLMGGALPLTTQHRNEWAALHGLLDQGRQTIAAPENGVAGTRAFGRFVNWLMPQYRQAGPGSLNPGAENYMFSSLPPESNIFDRFRPGPQDFATSPSGEKPKRSLAEIFGEKR